MTDTDPQTIATEELPPAIRTLWRLVAIVQGVVMAAGAIVVGLLLDSPLLLVGLTVGAVLVFGLRWWVIELRFANWRWGLDERWIERRSGVIIRTTQVVPRSRVQTLTTRTGPIDRWLGLSSIVVHTAGTHTPNLTIPHLDRETADRIRFELG